MSVYEAPAVQFYFGDFLNDTADMTLEERGAYITLLGYAWINIGIPLDEKKIRRILGISPHKFSRIWPELLPKFFALPDKYVNPRMEEERAKQIAYRAAKAEAGRKGGQASAASRGGSSASDSLEANGQQNPSPSSSTSSSSYESPQPKDSLPITATSTAVVAREELELAEPVDPTNRDEALAELRDRIQPAEESRTAA
ncbi:MAG: YdaU family protein [Sphingomonadales bacterium]|nr:YdaU family protein [Sphingomonadaceae bacterium]MBS3930804.1 YdaU family protein [Sphingomonadales bacterium]